ncbi:hypothetical protein Nepgr_023936 [Nepenthes gracilis]|uniref:Uncharacterized protein n=1 Tax=Nepenthes gracilis TaxID=150966 RepID=A0AAD3XYA9_NEPGR|nr:hypothetical protein Nepgr_023936 [Nepenthes gracilis]
MLMEQFWLESAHGTPVVSMVRIFCDIFFVDIWTPLLMVGMLLVFIQLLVLLDHTSGSISGVMQCSCIALRLLLLSGPLFLESNGVPMVIHWFALAAGDPSLGYLLARRPVITRIASRLALGAGGLLLSGCIRWQRFRRNVDQMYMLHFVAWPEVSCLSILV